MNLDHFRPLSSLDDQTPAEVVEKCKNSEEIGSCHNALPGASLREAMYFAAAEHP